MHKHRGGGHLYCLHILCRKSYQGEPIFSWKSWTVIVSKQAPMYATSKQIVFLFTLPQYRNTVDVWSDWSIIKECLFDHTTAKRAVFMRYKNAVPRGHFWYPWHRSHDAKNLALSAQVRWSDKKCTMLLNKVCANSVHMSIICTILYTGIFD